MRNVIVCRGYDVGYTSMCAQIVALRKDKSPEAAAIRKRLGIARKGKVRE